MDNNIKKKGTQFLFYLTKAKDNQNKFQINRDQAGIIKFSRITISSKEHMRATFETESKYL